MKQMESIWTGKKKLQENHALTREECEAILLVIEQAETVLIPTKREVDVYTEAKNALEHFKSREQQEALYSYFEPTVRAFEKKYKYIMGVA